MPQYQYISVPFTILGNDLVFSLDAGNHLESNAHGAALPISVLQLKTSASGISAIAKSQSAKGQSGKSPTVNCD
jgi:hypothetical protein